MWEVGGQCEKIVKKETFICPNHCNQVGYTCIHWRISGFRWFQQLHAISEKQEQSFKESSVFEDADLINIMHNKGQFTLKTNLTITILISTTAVGLSSAALMLKPAKVRLILIGFQCFYCSSAEKKTFFKRFHIHIVLEINKPL